MTRGGKRRIRVASFGVAALAMVIAINVLGLPSAFANNVGSFGLVYNNPANTVCMHDSVNVNWPADTPDLYNNQPIHTFGDTALSTCSGVLALPAGYIGVRVADFDRTYPSAHICAQQASYHYTTSTASYLSTSETFFPCNVYGIDVGATYSRALLYPAIWRYGSIGSPIAHCGPSCAQIV